MISDFLDLFFGSYFWLVIKYILILYPIWLPLILGIIFWILWLQYVRTNFAHNTDMVVLEIKLPREILKSPAAMEIVLNVFYQTGDEATFIDRYWDGKYRAVSSLEIASFGGEIHFFVYIRKAMRSLVEAALYAQYPNIEVYEVPDYTRNIVFNPSTMTLWGAEFILTKPDPYPLKTYVDYGLDKDPKEEFKNDPLTALLEYLGSLSKEEQAWYQIILRAHKSEKREGIFSKKTDWKDEAKVLVKDIIKNATIKPEGQEIGGPINLSDGERQLIASIERNISKTAFDCGMRGLYVAPKDLFRKVNISGLVGSLLHFNSNTANGFKPDNSTSFSYPWQDFRNIRLNSKRTRMMNAFKRRSYFFKPYKLESFVLSSEEIATLFHLPGQTAVVPSLVRVPSKKAEAPANLPV